MSFQASTNSGCEVTIYRQQGGGTIVLSGRTQSDKTPALVSCHVQAQLGGDSTFGVVCKPEAGDTFFASLVDDDWIDIVFTKNGKRWHVLRGLISGIRRTRQVMGTGVTTVTYSLSGRSFQRILTDTSVYLNIGQSANTFSDLANTVTDRLYGRLEDIQPRILLRVLQYLAENKRGSWILPVGMPNQNQQFYSTLQVDTSGVGPLLPREMEIKPFTIDNGNVWSLAQQYSDPAFTEIYCDQVDFDRPVAQRYDLDGTAGLGVDDTAMSVIVRDRPFIVVDPRLGAAIGKDSPWFALPKLSIDRRMIVSEDLGRSGEERLNSFNATTSFEQTTLGTPSALSFSPVWNTADMSAHGLRKLDTTSTYFCDTSSGVSEQEFNLRRKLLFKDWYCFNPQYLNGTLQLGTGAPHIHVGTRLYVQGRVPNDDLNFYVQGVSHSWQLGPGTKTSITVTRGYEGTDENHLAQLQIAASSGNYKEALFGLTRS
jgi:hypothetical protein